MRRIAAGERLDNYETVRLRKDGQPIDVSVTISPVRDASGTIVGASKIIRDITEKKRSERQIRTLIKEVNHRAKNMLALVQAIARQTVPAGQRAFLDGFLERLQALSANQDLLVENDWRGIVMADLVRVQIVPFNGLLGSRVIANGPPMQLTSAAAQSIGMALDELATNAVKFGALSTEEGGINIFWGRDGEDFWIDWAEHHGPPVTPPRQAGYGSRVVSTMLEIGIGARVDLDFGAAGLIWRLRCPVQRALVDADAVN